MDGRRATAQPETPRPAGPPGATRRPATLRAEALDWRLIFDPPASGAKNMALDHALARCLDDGRGVLRFYGWDVPTVSFGRNEPAVGRYDPRHPDAEGVAFVRRPTGGRAVLHDREVTYAVVAPLRAFGGPRDAYASINRGLVEGLRALGVPAAVATDGSVEALDAGPCFHAPAPGEVTAGGRKLVGSAQVRLGHVLLQHGSVILEGDQDLLDRISGRAERDAGPVAASGPRAAPADAVEQRARPAAASEWTRGSPRPAAVAAALAEGCRLAWGGPWTEGGYTPDERIEARRLVDERYATHDWTWRR